MNADLSLARLRSLPKAEVHAHLEGCFEPAVLDLLRTQSAGASAELVDALVALRQPRFVALSIDSNEAAADRIDHGVRAIEDPELVALLPDRRILLGVCPSSSLKLGVYASIEEHPIDRLRRAGVAASLNTDDPVLLGASLKGRGRVVQPGVRLVG